MRTFIRVLVLLPALVLGSCGGGGDAEQGPLPASVLGQEYLIGFGETIHVGALALEFTTLAEESRCPLNANCVWAGNARILVTATLGPHDGSVGAEHLLRAIRCAPLSRAISSSCAGCSPTFPGRRAGRCQEYTATVFVDRASN